MALTVSSGTSRSAVRAQYPDVAGAAVVLYHNKHSTGSGARGSVMQNREQTNFFVAKYIKSDMK